MNFKYRFAGVALSTIAITAVVFLFLGSFNFGTKRVVVSSEVEILWMEEGAWWHDKTQTFRKMRWISDPAVKQQIDVKWIIAGSNYWEVQAVNGTCWRLDWVWWERGGLISVAKILSDPKIRLGRYVKASGAAVIHEEYRTDFTVEYVGEQYLPYIVAFIALGVSGQAIRLAAEKRK